MRDQTRGFRLRPLAGAWYLTEGQTFVTINRRGYRDRERVPAPHPGVFRIAVIGDSSVIGEQVRGEQTLTQVAERALAGQTGNVEVLNFGVPNYGLAQQYLTLRDDVFAYQPDLVVQAVSLTNAILNSTRETCVNESPYPYFMERDGRLELYDPPPAYWLDSAREPKLLDLENHLDLALLYLTADRTVSDMADIWARRFHVKQPLPDDFYERSLFPPRLPAVEKAWNISERTIALTRDLCASRHVPFWMVTLDYPAQVDPDPKGREAFRARFNSPDLYYADSRLIRFAERENIPHIQAAPVLADYALRTGKCLHGFFNTPRNYGHLNVEGHSVLGALLAERLANTIPR
ncbi:MAG: lipolytic protein family [Bryobacterales bacterium]|nr:lipolytic protein family [Bryobacterales bacterium]